MRGSPWSSATFRYRCLIALGVLGPRGPFCIPLSMSSKPIVVLLRVHAPPLKTYRCVMTVQGAAGAGCRAQGFRLRRLPNSAIESPLRNGDGGMMVDRPIGIAEAIGIAGAGSIGCFVGGMLAAGGAALRCWRARA